MRHRKGGIVKLTISCIKADVGSIGGHTKPSERMMDAVRGEVARAIDDGLIIDGWTSYTGDDIAILMSHTRGENDEGVHQFAWDTFIKATEIAREYGLYGAGQDLLVDAPSGNVRGAGPAVAEIEMDHTLEAPRPAESIMLFAADKCGPGAYNLPIFLGFADPMYCGGLMLPQMIKGFTFHVIDMDNTGGDSIIELNAPEDYYQITALLRDNERFGIDGIYSRTTGQRAVSVSAQRLHSIAGVYTGKDDPIALGAQPGHFPGAGGDHLHLHQGPLRGRRRARLARHAHHACAAEHTRYRAVLPAAGVRGRLLCKPRRHVLGLVTSTSSTTRCGTRCARTPSARASTCVPRAGRARPCCPTASSSTEASATP